MCLFRIPKWGEFCFQRARTNCAEDKISGFGRRTPTALLYFTVRIPIALLIFNLLRLHTNRFPYTNIVVQYNSINIELHKRSNH